ncbi:MAG: hypothetical protein A2V85_06915 [Chloroflexi bacterium RBG_16_72_14]|nr:MAG: hypothetical protein A2V85_06915 [Chloroflexi bacterium RBG_16_72_14]
MLEYGMTRTRLQIDADDRTARIRATLADDLRRLRVDAGVSLTAAADAAGVDRSVVSRIEAGNLHPTLETYGRLAAALGADLAGAASTRRPGRRSATATRSAWPSC